MDNSQPGGLERISEFVHHKFLWLLLGAYALASVAPAAGLWIRGLNLGDVGLFGQQAHVALPSLMLAALLFNAGLGMQLNRMRQLVRNPFVLIAGLLGNLAVPLLFILGMSQTLQLWHNPTEVVLCYANAAVALPEVVANPDWDFLAMVLAIVLALCAAGFASGFASGWAIARMLGTDEASRTSLVFGLGMSNNGTGQLLAATALAHLPGVMLPVIFDNLVQHVVAAVANRLNRSGILAGSTDATPALLATSANPART